jgi:hypothetical protein
MYKQSDYEAIMKRPESGWAKYGSTQNFDKTIRHLVNGQYIPSIVSLKRAIKELGLRRVDGGSIQSDALAAQAAAQKNFDNVVAEVQQIPLSQEEFREFGSLSQLELSRKYFAEDGDYFRIRYDLACRIHGFRPAQRFASVTAEQDDGQVLELTPSQYRAIPAQVTTRRYMQEPQFRRAVDALVKAGKI